MNFPTFSTSYGRNASSADSQNPYELRGGGMG